MSDAWTWANHACRHCLGRLIERRGTEPGARPTYECGACSLTTTTEPHGICGCGILPKPVRPQPGPRFRCIPNPARCIASPAAIVIAWDEAPA